MAGVNLINNTGPWFDNQGRMLVTSSAGSSENTLALLTNVSATGPGTAQTWGGGSGLFSVVGTFGGCIVNLEYQGPNSVWVAAGSVSAAGGSVIGPIPNGAQVRANIVGGSPSGIYATFAS